MLKINTVTFDDDINPVSCDVTMTIDEVAVIVDFLSKDGGITSINPIAALALWQFDGLFRELYKDGIEGYRQQNKDSI